MPRPLAALAVALAAALALALPLPSGGAGPQSRYSENCSAGSPGKFANDTYTGTFEVRATGLGDLVQRVELVTWGRFEIEVRENVIQSAKGHAYHRMETFTTNFLQPSASSSAEGFVKSSGLLSDGPDQFHLTADLIGSASMGAAGTRLDFGGSATDLLTFFVVGGGCDYVEGPVRSRLIQQARERLQALGQYQLSDVSGFWSATTATKAGDAVRKLREDLDRATGGPAPGRVVRTRSTLAHNAANVARRLWDQYGEGPLIDCLLEFYRDYVARLFSGWVEQDTARLQNFRKSLRVGAPEAAPLDRAQVAALEEMMQDAIEADRSLALFGVDTCYAEVHARLWAELRESLDFLLEHLVASGAPPHDLFEVLRRAELLGEVSPGLRESVYAEVRTRAEALFQQFHASFRSARAASPGSCDAPVQRLFNSVLAAALQCQLLGGAADFPGGEDAEWIAGCRARAGAEGKP